MKHKNRCFEPISERTPPLLHQLGRWIIFYPFIKPGIGRLQPGQSPLEILSLYTHQITLVRVPERAGFLVIEHKRAAIGPSRGRQGECLSIDFAAVHSRQIDKRSVAGDDRLGTQIGVGGFV